MDDNADATDNQVATLTDELKIKSRVQNIRVGTFFSIWLYHNSLENCLSFCLHICTCRIDSSDLKLN